MLLYNMLCYYITCYIIYICGVDKSDNNVIVIHRNNQMNYLKLYYVVGIGIVYPKKT